MPDLLEYKHSRHLTGDKPDDPALALKNLERIANALLENRNLKLESMNQQGRKRGRKNKKSPNR